MKYIWSLLIAILFIFGACGPKETKSALKQGDALKSSVESFEKSRQKLSNNLVNSLEEAGEKLAAEDPNLPKVSKDFEKDWNRIQNQYEKLQKDFASVGTSSEAYFTKLDELSGSIKDDQLRKEELGKNNELRQRWEVSYKKAQQSINNVTGVLQSGHDFHMVLVASSIRQKLEQNVQELDRIATQAKELLTDLEAFTEAGRELVEG